MKFQYYAKHNGSKTSTILKKYFRSFSIMLNIMVPKQLSSIIRVSSCFSTMLNIMVPKPRLKFWDFGVSAYSWGVWITPLLIKKILI